MRAWGRIRLLDASENRICEGCAMAALTTNIAAAYDVNAVRDIAAFLTIIYGEAI